MAALNEMHVGYDTKIADFNHAKLEATVAHCSCSNSLATFTKESGLSLLYTHIFIARSTWRFMLLFSILLIYAKSILDVYLRQGGYVIVIVCLCVFLSVCLLATLRKSFWIDFHKIFWEIFTDPDPYRDTCKTCLGGGIHCPSAFSLDIRCHVIIYNPFALLLWV